MQPAKAENAMFENITTPVFDPGRHPRHRQVQTGSLVTAL
jgi:hypothetical protein